MEKSADSSIAPQPVCSKSGIAKGSRRSVFFCPIRPTFIIYYFAILKAGGTVVNFNPLYTLEELTLPDPRQRDRADDHARSQGAVRQGRGAAGRRAPEAGRSRARSASLLPAAKSVLFRLFKRASSRTRESPVADRIIREANAARQRRPPQHRWPSIPVQDVAVLQYTGGTTGTPEGRHAHPRQRLHQHAAGRGVGARHVEPSNERMIGALPFFHVFAMTGVMNFAIAHRAPRS
ncbi:MAG: AMP-binding protein [Pirellulales bacterium]